MLTCDRHADETNSSKLKDHVSSLSNLMIECHHYQAED